MNGSQKAHESYLSGSQKRDTAEGRVKIFSHFSLQALA